MKLKIEHLAPYLPYDLQLIFPKSGRMITMQSCFYVGKLLIKDTNVGDCYDLSIWNFKPILLPIYELGFYVNGLKHLGYKIEKDDIENIISDIKQGKAEYDIMQMCFQEHIDVFDLIKNGLAIDKNTLNNE